MVSAEAQERQAEVDLNRILNRPLEEKFQTVEQTWRTRGYWAIRVNCSPMSRITGISEYSGISEVEEGIKAAP